MPSVLVFGSTGFVGVPLIKALKDAHPTWPVTAYARGSRSAEEIKSELRADEVVLGDFSEHEKIKALSKKHDIVINAGNSFTKDPVAAIVEGLKEREGSDKGKLIHVSGAGNFIDFGTTGEYNPESKVWRDDSEEDIRQINEQMFNGQSDTVVLGAGSEVDTYIVCTSVTYGGAAVGSKGIGIGEVLITSNAKPLGYVPYVGKGTALLSTTHILDLIPFMLKIVDLAAAGPAQGSAYSRWYNVETAKVQWKDLATELAKIMHEKGVFSSPEPKSVSIDEAGDGEVKYLVAANMLLDCKRSASLGYEPKQPSILSELRKDLKNATL